MTTATETELHPLALVPGRHDLPEQERQEQDEAEEWAAEMRLNDWLEFCQADGLQAVALKMEKQT